MSSTDCNTNAVFDLKSVIERTGLDLEEFMEIFELFEESYHELMTDMRAAVDSEDSEKAMHAAHTLKGASINMGFESLSDLAFQIQSNPEDFTLSKDLIPKLDSCFEDLSAQVKVISENS